MGWPAGCCGIKALCGRAARLARMAPLACLLMPAGHAATFVLPPPGSDVVGEVGTARVAAGETLLDIARAHGLGYNEITAANPGIDPWLPPPASTVMLPTRFILPSAPRRGIIINLAEMRLYYYPPPANDQPVVLTFPIGIGQEGWTTPLGITEVVSKVKDPPWTVPPSIRAEHEREGNPLPAIVPPGPDNPLGNYALRLGLTSYLIHGTNKPYGIGRRASHGCIRLYPEDIEVLFQQVAVSTAVWIINQPYKLGLDTGRLYLEAHAPLTEPGRPPLDYFTTLLSAITAVNPAGDRARIRDVAASIVMRETGIPETVADLPQAGGYAPEGWMLQLGAFSHQGNAGRLAAELRELGATVTLTVNANDGYCHVLAGPYADQGGALAALEEIRQTTGYTGRIVAADRPGTLAECLP